MEQEFGPLLEAVEEFRAGISQRPEWVELDAAYRECLANAGFPNGAGQFDFESQYLRPARAGMTSPEESERWSTTDEAKALLEIEIDMALAVFDCGVEVDYADRSQAIRFAAEEQFVADHKTELEAFRAAAEQRPYWS
jgi:hypothetical protein